VRHESHHADHRAPLTVDSTDGVTLAVHDLAVGDPSRPARSLLLAHATGFHGLVWAPLVRHLPAFHAWAPDLRGHGDSNAPTDRGMDWDGFADDILAVVDALRDQGLVGHELVAAGHSKGGAALLLAEQRRPGTFRALYCYEPVVFPPDFHEPEPGTPHGGTPNPLAEGALRRRDTFASRDEALANYAGKLPFSALDPEALRAYVDHGFADRPEGGVQLKCRPEIEAAVYRMGSAHHGFEHLGEVACPVTVAIGAISDFGPAAFASRIAGALPRGRLESHPDLGHFGPLEAPARIAASIDAAFTPA
jgi:pimeloyl-ACP methyl ester carboxylesterase